jgi:hypothetical protein
MFSSILKFSVEGYLHQSMEEISLLYSPSDYYSSLTTMIWAYSETPTISNHANAPESILTYIPTEIPFWSIKQTFTIAVYLNSILFHSHWPVNITKTFALRSLDEIFVYAVAWTRKFNSRYCACIIRSTLFLSGPSFLLFTYCRLREISDESTTRVYCRYWKWGVQLRRDSTGVSWNKDSEQNGDRRNFIRSLRSPMSPILYVSSLGGAIHAQIDLHCHSRTPSSVLCLAPYTLRSLMQIRGITILDQPTEARSTQPCHRGWIFRIQKGPLRLKKCTSALPTSERYNFGIQPLRIRISVYWWHSDLLPDSEGSLGAGQSI